MASLALALAACAGPYAGSTQQVSESRPEVTYAFSDDTGLVEATRRAEDYCRTYNAWPRNAGITENTPGTKMVHFRCDRPVVAATVPVPTAAAYPTPVPVPARAQPSVSYVYRTDQELVDATSSAAAYCTQFAARPRTFQVTPNTDGSRTVVFDCVRI